MGVSFVRLRASRSRIRKERPMSDRRSRRSEATGSVPNAATGIPYRTCAIDRARQMACGFVPWTRF